MKSPSGQIFRHMHGVRRQSRAHLPFKIAKRIPTALVHPYQIKQVAPHENLSDRQIHCLEGQSHNGVMPARAHMISFYPISKKLRGDPIIPTTPAGDLIVAIPAGDLHPVFINKIQTAMGQAAAGTAQDKRAPRAAWLGFFQAARYADDRPLAQARPEILCQLNPGARRVSEAAQADLLLAGYRSPAPVPLLR